MKYLKEIYHSVSSPEKRTWLNKKLVIENSRTNNHWKKAGAFLGHYQTYMVELFLQK